MRIPIPARYRQLRASAPFETASVGYHGIRLIPAAELEQAQQGYGVVGDEETDWDPNWLVIGHDEMCGDQIFIDTTDEDVPVYTAEHGTGDWSPRLIAFSFQHLIDILAQFRSFRGGRASPMELERRPIAGDWARLLSFIRERNPEIDMSFWEDWLQDED